MRVPDAILSSAIFLCVKKDGVLTPAATGFVLVIESDAPRDNWHSYIVTARHNIERAARHGSLYVRVNQFVPPGVPAQAAEIELRSAWEYHEDDVSDVAVTPFPGPPIYPVMRFERSSLATADLIAEKAIGIGEELIVVGLFTSHYGREANRPIVRSGIIAAMADEPAQDDRSGLDFDAYLAEVRSIGGLSGSPVWVVLNPFSPGSRESGWQFYLLGLIRGHWKKEEDWTSDFGGGGELEALNTGIAIVTPIQKALDIIDSSEVLVKERKENDRERARKHAERGGSEGVAPDR